MYDPGRTLVWLLHQRPGYGQSLSCATFSAVHGCLAGKRVGVSSTFSSCPLYQIFDHGSRKVRPYLAVVGRHVLTSDIRATQEAGPFNPAGGALHLHPPHNPTSRSHHRLHQESRPVPACSRLNETRWERTIGRPEKVDNTDAGAAEQSDAWCTPWALLLKDFPDPSQFEKTFTINLPSRSDKLDSIRVAADLTGFDLDVIEGVNGDLLPDKALPGVCASPDVLHLLTFS